MKKIKLNEIISIGEYQIKPIEINHIAGSCGFVITKNHQSFIISGDTYLNPIIWEEINNNKTIKCLIIECSFPDKFDELAKVSKHLTPNLIAKS